MALDKQQIVDEAVALLDADGLDGLTLRKLAGRLGVRAPTLYWHLPNKAALITAIADAILDAMPPAAAPGQRWQEWLIGLAEGLRHALRAHPDGARVVAAAQLSLKMAALSEAGFTTLMGYGMPLRDARLLVLTVERFTIGHVLEEQSPPPDPSAFDMAAYTTMFPTVIAGITEYFAPGRTPDDLFRDCVRLIVEGPASPR